MKINKVHCFFEQSGTFKNAFLKNGVPAEDYDILNDFGQTDHIIDLFSEIDKAYEGKASLFDNIGECDLVFAFFPCTRFSEGSAMLMRGVKNGCEKWGDEQRLKYSMEIHEQLHELYMRICKLFSLCLRGGRRLIVENPSTQPHYLTQYFPIKPSIIDKDRTRNGDYYKKPTQYWFVNCEPENNVIFEQIEPVKTGRVAYDWEHFGNMKRAAKRSLIHPQYADRFVRQFILDGGNT